MTETAEAIKIQRGLKSVYFDRSPCTFIDGKAGELRYRGYSIHDLAEHSSFEETAFLLLNGELPGKQQLAGLDAELKAARKLPAPVGSTEQAPGRGPTPRLPRRRGTSCTSCRCRTGTDHCARHAARCARPAAP